jgi:hypothetical protein
MDPFGFGKLIAEKWDIVMMSPGVSAAVFGIGLIIGWAAARLLYGLVYGERMLQQQARIDDLQKVLEEKLPVNFLPPAQRERSGAMSFGFWLITIGLIVVSVGSIIVFRQSGDKSVKPQDSANQTSNNTAGDTLPPRHLNTYWAIQYSKELQKFNKPGTHWHYIATSPSSNEQIRQEISSIIRHGVGFTVANPIGLPDGKNLDAPKFPNSRKPGIVIHGSNEVASELVTILGQCFKVYTTTSFIGELEEYYQLKPITWIEIGEGSPWNESPGIVNCF